MNVLRYLSYSVDYLYDSVLGLQQNNIKNTCYVIEISQKLQDPRQTWQLEILPKIPVINPTKK
jgi:hypothetical protein